ncbi:switch-activating protein Sap1 [Ancistrocladus abbreviatus]
MAQKTEKEETEFKVPETLTLCVNNCGFTGNPATNNMCQKCFNNASSAGIVASHKVSGAETSRSSSSTSPERFSEPTANTARRDLKDQDRTPVTEAEGSKQTVTVTVKREVNRCFGCRRRVGLTGFRCRCGELFCAEHRYTDRHDCSYDYKAAGREAIARENPVVKAAKIVKL